ncbi:hypothetical protein GOFOIKOB_6527 [Methylobacterium tardum]|nr:hypothetical protein GOFOIKOB_6527 [Methylobacterium tardum]
MIESEVCDPTVSGAKRMAAAMLGPLLDPATAIDGSTGLIVWPPVSLRLLLDNPAHWPILALPIMSRPCSRIPITSVASAAGPDPIRAAEPAVVRRSSAVPIFILSSTGTPKSGGSVRPWRCASIRCASA